MFYDPYDEKCQVKFYRQDPTGRFVPLEDEDEMRADTIEVIGALVAFIVIVAIVAWWIA